LPQIVLSWVLVGTLLVAAGALVGCRASQPGYQTRGATWHPMISLFVPPVEGGPRYRHRVAEGETLLAIADRYGVAAIDLATENDLTLGAEPPPETELTLPANARLIHVVRRGETLSHLAVWYRMPVEQIAEVNHIEDPRQLHVGAELWIPPGAGQVPIVTPQLADVPMPPPETPREASLAAAERLLVEGETRYRAAEFESALRDAVGAQARATSATPTEPRDRLVARAALLEGMAQTALGETEAAQRAFEKALRLDPELHLDPQTASPKILRALEIARGAVFPANQGAPPTSFEAAP